MISPRYVHSQSMPVPRSPFGRHRTPGFLLALSGVLVLAGVLAAPGASAAARVAELDRITGQLDREQQSWLATAQVPGAAVALVRDGQLAWTGSYGQADPARRVPVTTDTVFQVASISKPVTAWGVLRLVDKGALSLDAPVETYLTRWHLPSSRYDTAGVTIRRLLTHSAGLSEHGYAGRPPTQSPHSLEVSLSGVRIVQEPGSGYRYSGGGYTVLQLVIEEVTGEPFAAYMQREVLDPLGMTRSSFEWRADLRPATAIGHNTQGQPYPNYLFTEKAAAGLYTTAADLARFVAAAMIGPQGQPAGRAVLSPGTVAEMLTPVVFTDESVAAGVTGPLHQTTTGLGYGIGAAPDGTQLVGHGGKNQGWEAFFEIQLERREGIVILTNSDHGSEFGERVVDAWYNWLRIGTTEAPRSAEPNDSTQTTAALAVAGLGVLTAILWGGYLLLRVYRAKRRA